MIDESLVARCCKVLSLTAKVYANKEPTERYVGMEMGPASAYLTYVAVEKQREIIASQERILTEQHKTLKAQEGLLHGMRWHSWAMLILTVAILIATAVNIWATLKGG